MPERPGDNQTRNVMAAMGLWALLAFAFHLAWEIAHIRLYEVWSTSEPLALAWAILHCTAGDVMIALALFALAGLAVRDPDWPQSKPWPGIVLFTTGALLYTAWSEWYNVYVQGAWTYASAMPLVLGIGLSPLVQWLILPAVMLGTWRMAVQRLNQPRHSA